MQTNKGEIESVKVEEGDMVNFVDGAFKYLEKTVGELVKVDRRSETYPYTVRVPNGEGHLDIPCARWEFRKI